MKNDIYFSSPFHSLPLSLSLPHFTQLVIYEIIFLSLVYLCPWTIVIIYLFRFKILLSYSLMHKNMKNDISFSSPFPFSLSPPHFMQLVICEIIFYLWYIFVPGQLSQYISLNLRYFSLTLMHINMKNDISFSSPFPFSLSPPHFSQLVIYEIIFCLWYVFVPGQLS
jgi:hypothetical protein